jgi:DNA-binding transcriptional LysR family regulator
MLDVKRMRVLREVALQGSFSAAAETLAYTQSAVSQQIAALEREAGVKLVNRNARGVDLTDAGRVLVGHADAILARLADAEAELGDMAGLRGGRVRMTTFATAGATIVPQAIAMFRERYPGVEIELAPEEPHDQLGLLRAGESDVAVTITATFDPPPADGVDMCHLLDDPMYLLLPEGHPLADKPRPKMKDLADSDWILGTSGWCPDGRILIRACQEAGFEPRIGMQSDDYLAIQGFVAAGFGVSLIPDLALIAVRDDVVVRSLGPRPPMRRIMAASLSDCWASPARAAMLDILEEVGDTFSTKRRELALAS